MNFIQTSSPWQEAANAARGLGGGLTAAMSQLPQQRAQAMLMQQQLLNNQFQLQQAQALAPGQLQTQQQGLQLGQAKLAQVPLQNEVTRAKAGAATAQGDMYTAQGKRATAQAGYEDQRTASLKGQDKLHLDAGASMFTLLQELATNGQASPDTLARAGQNLSQLNKTDPNLFPQLQKMLATSASGMATNPAVATSIASGAHIPLGQVVPAGATLASPVTGATIANNPRPASSHAANPQAALPSVLAAYRQQLEEQAMGGAPANVTNLMDQVNFMQGRLAGGQPGAMSVPQTNAPVAAPAIPARPLRPTGSGTNTLSPDIAVQFYQKAGGDKAKARQMAVEAGYTF